MNGGKVAKSGGGVNLDKGKAIMNLILNTSNLRMPVRHSDKDSPSFPFIPDTPVFPSPATHILK